MLLRRIYILMSQNISHKIDVSGLFIKRCAIGASKLVGRDLFCRRHLPGILLNHIFHRLDTHPPLLRREKQGIFMAGEGSGSLSVSLNIVLQSLFYFFPEIYNHLVAALARNRNPIILKIYICKVEADAFGDTDSRAKKQSQYRKIAVLRLLIIVQCLSGQFVSAVLYKIQKQGDLIRIQTDNRLIMKFWHFHQQSRVLGDSLTLKIIVIETSKRRHLAGKAFFPIGHQFVVTLVDLQVFHIFLNIHRLQPFKVT